AHQARLCRPSLRGAVAPAGFLPGAHPPPRRSHPAIADPSRLGFRHSNTRSDLMRADIVKQAVEVIGPDRLHQIIFGSEAGSPFFIPRVLRTAQHNYVHWNG